MTEARDKAKKAMDNFYKRIREGNQWDEIYEAEFQRAKDVYRKAEFNLEQIKNKGLLPCVPPAKIKEYIQKTFGEMTQALSDEKRARLITAPYWKP